MTYPVLEILPELLSALRAHPIVVLQAPPGTGKSTVLPLHLKNDFLSPSGTMFMLEPRRLAARSIAARMAAMEKENVGESIGYRIRFENRISEKTRIQVVTDGILTRLLQSDDALNGVELVVFDEFHERSLQADTALALCRQIQDILRPDVRILIMSATLDSDFLSSQLGNAPVIRATGKVFPVKINYLNTPFSGALWQEVTRILPRVIRETSGDILCFLPGTAEIKRVKDTIQSYPEMEGMALHTLFGELSLSLQQQAIEPDQRGRRKVILATSIAETSLTIEGVSVVVDGGQQRLPFFDPRTGLTRLETVRVTRDAADQRAGRAGRLGPGTCYRLWTAAEQHQLLDQRRPEVADADLAPLVLEMANWGVTDWRELDWITAPPNGTWNQARELLHELEALEANKITARGKKMAVLPTHPRLAHVLLHASEQKNETRIALACDLAAILEERDLFDRNQGSDICARIELLRKWRSGSLVNADRGLLERIEKLSKSWRTYFRVQAENGAFDYFDAGRLLAEAYPERIAQLQDKKSGRYKLLTGNTAKLNENDPMQHFDWLVVAHVDAGVARGGGAQEGRIYLSAPLHFDDLKARAKRVRSIYWDLERDAVAGSVDLKVGNLTLESKPISDFSQAERVATINKTIREKGIRFLGWEEEEWNWINRMQSLKEWRPEENWPDVSDQNLLETLETWLNPFIDSIKSKAELQKLDWKSILNSLVPWDLQQKMLIIAPEKVEVPSGSFIKLTYFADGRNPVMEVRLQELFGLAETPAVNAGRTPVMLHLLSPGFKPVQVTQDLRSFWNSTYFEVRKELKQRYPRHSWPDDPWTAEAIRGAKKRKPNL